MKIVFVLLACLALNHLHSLGAQQGNLTLSCDLLQPKYVCPETGGWTGHLDDERAVCLWLSRSKASFEDAYNFCNVLGGRLTDIPSERRQKTIQKMLENINENVWIGLSRKSGERSFTWAQSERNQLTYINAASGYNFDGREYQYQKQCVYLKTSDQKWVPTDSCHNNLLYLCEKSAECNAGHYGKRCDEECHCHGGLCHRVQPCSYGCEIGWMGPRCCTRKKKSEVKYYCTNSAEYGRILLMRIDPKYVSYDVIEAVDDTGVPIPWCNDTEIVQDTSGRYTVKIPVKKKHEMEMGVTCAGRKTGHNSFSWRLVLQEKKGVVLPLDRLLQFSCDFDKADNMEREHKSGMEQESSPLAENKNILQSEQLEVYGEDVVLEVIDPSTGKPLSQALLGTNVVLRMRINVSNDIMAHGVSPFNCRASSPDGQYLHSLTDHKGCPVQYPIISAMTGSNGTVSSQPFQIFAFPGHMTIVFTCSFQFCFIDDQAFCDNRCLASSQKKNRRRLRRNTDETKDVSASIRVVNDPRLHSQADGFHGDALGIMNPVSWVLLFLVVAMAVFILFVLSGRCLRKQETGNCG